MSHPYLSGCPFEFLYADRGPWVSIEFLYDMTALGDVKKKLSSLPGYKSSEFCEFNKEQAVRRTGPIVFINDSVCMRHDTRQTVVVPTSSSGWC